MDKVNLIYDDVQKTITYFRSKQNLTEYELGFLEASKEVRALILKIKAGRSEF